MNMQDKELDQLFRSKLQNFEVEPSAGLWQGISAGANKQKKRIYTAWLSAAAGLLILLSAALYFTRGKDAVADNTTPVARVKKTVPLQLPLPADVLQKSAGKSATAENTIAVKPVVKAEKYEVTGPKIEVKQDEARGDNYLAQVTSEPVTERREPLVAVVPGVETPLKITQDTEDNVEFKTQMIAPEVQVPQQAKAVAAAPAKKHRIRSLGDILNVVISKVDKRKDKIIEFTNTDDDESTVTGLNLGIIKIKKQD